MHNRLNTLLLVVFLSLFISRAAVARAEYYQYNGNLPFVEMMLNMMTVMGMLNKVPPQYITNGYGGYNGLNNYYNKLLLRNALLNRGGWNSLALSSPGLNSLSLASPGLNPYGLSQYSQNPYSLSPYRLNSLSLYNTRVNPLWASPWSSSSRTAYPWSSSPWNNIWRDSFPPHASYYSATEGLVPRYAPLAQPPLYDYSSRGRRLPHGVSTPLAKLYSNRDWPKYPVPPATGGWRGLPGSNDSPCVTEFCGLLNPQRGTGNNPVLSLNGLWKTNSGEMLGIKDNHFLWSNGGSRYLTGTLRILRDRLIARVDEEGNDRVMQYRYRVENNHLFTQDSHGLVRVFTRVPVN